MTLPSPAHRTGPVNVLLIGGGGREASIAWKLRQSTRLGTLFTTDAGNPGIAAIAKAAGVAVDPRDYFPIRSFCLKNQIGLVVVGPEDPLATGITDALQEPLYPDAATPLVFGPTRAAARLEADKAFAKDVMRGASIPTAEARVFTDPEAARAFIESRSEPHVIKAAGLAKGKGVIVPTGKAEALAAIERMMVQREFGDAGRTVVIEERLKGREVSVLALVDGRNIFVLEACQDHKRLGDGATGPNTGGMGAICPPAVSPALDDRLLASVERDILVPTVDALRREGIEFRGVLYAGLMLTPAGPKVLEFNCRFGDPECQALMRRLRADLLEVLLATAARRLHEVEISWTPGSSVCVVLASPGYPDKPRSGLPIDGIEAAEAEDDVVVFHAGTRRDERGRIVTGGGRVLNVTATGATPAEARARAYRGVERIRFEGMTYRTDIGTDVVG
ncbi:MAG: phosphoribosylamine--glycine ligase [Phycisphaerales bacterium]